nr:helix-turn-helix transcriptional regulator [Saccharothrix espanaensis]
MPGGEGGVGKRRRRVRHRRPGGFRGLPPGTGIGRPKNGPTGHHRSHETGPGRRTDLLPRTQVGRPPPVRPRLLRRGVRAGLPAVPAVRRRQLRGGPGTAGPTGRRGQGDAARTAGLAARPVRPRAGARIGPAGPAHPREQEVLWMLSERCTNGQIARSLGISTNTVKNHVAAILRKLGLRSRFDLFSRTAPGTHPGRAVRNRVRG